MTFLWKSICILHIATNTWSHYKIFSLLDIKLFKDNHETYKRYEFPRASWALESSYWTWTLHWTTMYMCNKADADGQVRRPLWPDSQLSARVRTMTRPQLRTNVHNSIADTIVCKCSQSGMKWRTLEGIVLVRLLLARLKRKNVTDV